MARGLAFAVIALLLGACASRPPVERALSAQELALLDRITWGANATAAHRMATLGPQRWLEQQLAPPADDDLPAAIAAQVKTMTISQASLRSLAEQAAERRPEGRHMQSPDRA